MESSLSANIKTRAVFFIGGYDPKSPDAFYTRMDRELVRFTNLWGASIEQQPMVAHGDDVTIRRFDTTSDEWKTRNRFPLFDPR